MTARVAGASLALLALGLVPGCMLLRGTLGAPLEGDAGSGTMDAGDDDRDAAKAPDAA